MIKLLRKLRRPRLTIVVNTAAIDPVALHRAMQEVSARYKAHGGRYLR